MTVVESERSNGPAGLSQEVSGVGGAEVDAVEEASEEEEVVVAEDSEVGSPSSVLLCAVCVV